MKTSTNISLTMTKFSEIRHLTEEKIIILFANIVEPCFAFYYQQVLLNVQFLDI